MIVINDNINNTKNGINGIHLGKNAQNTLKNELKNNQKNLLT